jgi:hypothetical protein
MNKDNREQGLKLHKYISHRKDLIVEAKIELAKLENLEYIECVYELNYNNWEGTHNNVRVNAPVTAVITKIQKDIDKLETQLTTLVLEYTTWLGE